MEKLKARYLSSEPCERSTSILAGRHSPAPHQQRARQLPSRKSPPSVSDEGSSGGGGSESFEPTPPGHWALPWAKSSTSGSAAGSSSAPPSSTLPPLAHPRPPTSPPTPPLPSPPLAASYAFGGAGAGADISAAGPLSPFGSPGGQSAALKREHPSTIAAGGATGEERAGGVLSPAEAARAQARIAMERRIRARTGRS